MFLSIAASVSGRMYAYKSLLKENKNYFCVGNFLFRCKFVWSNADVAELVDALDLGSSAARCGGSSPSIRTRFSLTRKVSLAARRAAV